MAHSAMSFLFLLAFSATILIGTKGTVVAPSTLRLVHLVYRHGDRTPVKPYPTDPYRTLDNWPVSWGQLTNDGKDRQFRLGQFNRQRYGSFLSDDYIPEEIYVRSTDVDRTLMSAQSHLAGLYPPTDQQTWNKDLPWQPIPIHTVNRDEDLLLLAESKCDRYDKLLEELNNSPVVQKRMEDNRQLLDFLAQHTNLTMKEIDDIEYLYDTLFIESRFNKSLPEWTKDVFPLPMKELSDFSFELKAYTPDMQRLKGGPWIKEVVDNLRNYTKTTLGGNNLAAWKRKMYMYSGHDVTVATVLSAFQVFNKIQPPYASMVLVELHELKPKEHFVQVLYKNVSDDGEDPFPLTLPGCDEFCPLDKFYQLVANVTADDLVSECKLPTPANHYDPIIVICSLSALSGLLLLALLVVCAIWYRRERMSNGYSYTTIQAE